MYKSNRTRIENNNDYSNLIFELFYHAEFDLFTINKSTFDHLHLMVYYAISGHVSTMGNNYYSKIIKEHV
jgi:methenyltetrahydromethanopterin cyclohydrolase